MNPNMVQFFCLICGASLPESALAGETCGPLFCDDHNPADLRKRGTIGAVPDEEWSIRAPINLVQSQIRGHRIARCYVLREPRTVVLVLDDDAVLLLFTTGYRTVHIQYVPCPSMPRALASLDEISDTDSDLSAILTAKKEELKITNLTYGITPTGSSEENNISFHFENSRILDAECVGHSFYEIGSGGEVTFDWRDHWLR